MYSFGLGVKNMSGRMKRAAKNLIVHNAAILRIFFGMFFDKKYLSGRHFSGSHKGWIWTAKAVWFQKVLGFNRYIPWPAHHTIKIANINKIKFHPDDINIFQSPGVYFQSLGAEIIIGKGAYIAPNVGLITTNHDPSDLNKHLEGKPVNIGERCWIGMNSIVLPGITIGHDSIVGAGSVVTKDIPPNSIAVGNPAKIIKVNK